ncbi:hypothetical protein C8R44DRAFT_726136 [Mycena epipterygia]|nr:hypothetical protein C8R44DRAFT_726136 [Mycena epipterygia]
MSFADCCLRLEERVNRLVQVTRISGGEMLQGAPIQLLNVIFVGEPKDAQKDINLDVPGFRHEITATSKVWAVGLRHGVVVLKLGDGPKTHTQGGGTARLGIGTLPLGYAMAARRAEGRSPASAAYRGPWHALLALLRRQGPGKGTVAMQAAMIPRALVFPARSLPFGVPTVGWQAGEFDYGAFLKRRE